MIIYNTNTNPLAQCLLHLLHLPAVLLHSFCGAQDLSDHQADGVLGHQGCLFSLMWLGIEHQKMIAKVFF